MKRPEWWIGLTALILVVVVAPLMVGAMIGPALPFGPGMMGGYGPWGMPPWMIDWHGFVGFGWLAMLAFWGALIVGVVLLARAIGRAEPTDRHEAPLDILRRRYAAGEITSEEYERMRRDLAA